jgi:L-ribulose-5-phosphate 3-epimerase
MKRLLLLPAFLAALTMTTFAAPLDAIPKTGTFVAGVQAWTFNKGTLFEAIDQTKAAGGNVLEVYLMGMKIGGDLGETVLDETLSDADIAKVLNKCRETGVRIVNAYIGSKQWERIGSDEAELRKFFVFGKKIGVAGFTGEPAERQWDMLEKLLKEFDVTFSIHNHIRGFEAPYLGGEYKYWNPLYTFERLRERDPRFGICFDTGHYVRSQGDALQTLKTIGSRCLSVHLKDVVAADPDGHDVPYGTGILDVHAFLAELRRQNFHGHIAVEYEWFTPHLSEDVKKCFEFLRADK